MGAKAETVHVGITSVISCEVRIQYESFCAFDRIAVSVKHGTAHLQGIVFSTNQALDVVFVVWYAAVTPGDTRNLAGAKDKGIPYFGPNEVITKAVYKKRVTC